MQSAIMRAQFLHDEASASSEAGILHPGQADAPAGWVQARPKLRVIDN